MSTVYKIKVIYKSGASMEFECISFSVHDTASSRKIEWQSYGDVKPLMLNAEDVSSVWQLGSRTVE